MRNNKESRLVPPDAVFLIAWPLLKVLALAADVQVIRARDRVALALRAADWISFALFPRIAARSSNAAAISAATATQTIATAAVVRRARGRDPRIARWLTPQLIWLVYASVLPLVIAAKSRVAARWLDEARCRRRGRRGDGGCSRTLST